MKQAQVGQVNEVNLYESPELINWSDMFIFEPQSVSIAIGGSVIIDR